MARLLKALEQSGTRIILWLLGSGELVMEIKVLLTSEAKRPGEDEDGRYRHRGQCQSKDAVHNTDGKAGLQAPEAHLQSEGNFFSC